MIKFNVILNNPKWKKYLKNPDLYIKKKIIKLNKKKIYQTNKKNIVGIDIKPEYPKNPDIRLKNNFKSDINKLSKKAIKKIDNILK